MHKELADKPGGAELPAATTAEEASAIPAVKAVLDELLAPFDEGPDLWKSPEIWAVAGYGGYALVTGADPVFCPEGPTSAQALLVAKSVTTLALSGWGAYVLGAARKAASAKPQ